MDTSTAHSAASSLLQINDNNGQSAECLPLLNRTPTETGNGGNPSRKSSLRFQIAPAEEQRHNGSHSRRVSSASNGNFRRKRSVGSSINGGVGGSSTSYRRWSSRRRRFSTANFRRQSRLPSDLEFEDAAAALYHAHSCLSPGGGGGGGSPGSGSGGFGCVGRRGVRCSVPLRTHGLCIAGVATVLSLAGLVASATLLLRNAILTELASIPPGCSGYIREVTWCIYVHRYTNQNARICLVLKG